MTATPHTRPRIVAGYDGSAAARAAVSHALRRAGEDGRIIIVHAFKPPSGLSASLDFDEMLRAASARACRRVERLVDEVPGLAAADWAYEVVASPSARAILRVAEQQDASEIVIGTRGAGRARALLGSVAHDVLHRARCPVYVIPARAVAARRVQAHA
jgi:nucleotide-binding universal stress UspA family protein